MKPILLIGGGGHARACIDVIETESAFSIQGIVERAQGSCESVLGYKVVGCDTDLARLLKTSQHALVTVGQLKSSATREILFSLLLDKGAILPVIISPKSYVSKHSFIGIGTIILHGAIVNASAIIGVNCIVNSQSLIEHDSLIGDHCHVSTGAKINGGVKIGSGTFIGSGAVIREGVRIGARCIVGAGSVVKEDLPDASQYVGGL